MTVAVLIIISMTVAIITIISITVAILIIVVTFVRWYSFLTTCDEDSDFVKNYTHSKRLSVDVFTMKNLNLPQSTLSPQQVKQGRPRSL